MNIQLNIDISRFRTGYPWESHKIVQSSNINYDIQIVQINIYSSITFASIPIKLTEDQLNLLDEESKRLGSKIRFYTPLSMYSYFNVPTPVI